jgi:hypothetical protein
VHVRVELPDNNWVDIREKITHGERNAFIRVLAATEGNTILRAIESNDFMVQTMIDAWSFDLPLPSVDPTSLDKLDHEDVNAVMGALRPHMQHLFPNFGAENAADPQSPTAPSPA